MLHRESVMSEMTYYEEIGNGVKNDGMISLGSPYSVLGHRNNCWDHGSVVSVDLIVPLRTRVCRDGTRNSSLHAGTDYVPRYLGRSLDRGEMVARASPAVISTSNRG